MKEKRKHVRVPIAAYLKISIEGTGDSMQDGFIKNISENGIGLEMPKQIRLQDRIRLNFTLPDGNTYDLGAKVKYVKEGVLTVTHGVEFSDIRSSQRTQLAQYLNLHIKESNEFNRWKENITRDQA